MGPEKAELLEAALRQMPGAVLVADAPSGRVLLENPKVAAIWRDRNDGVPFRERTGYHADGRAYAAADWPLARAVQGEVIDGEEIGIRRADGTNGVVMVSASPIRDKNDVIVAAISTMYDVTEQKERDAARFEESEAGNRAKSDFLAVISHELRTPLTAIIGYTELLALGIPEPATPGQQDQLERIDLAARHLQQLIDEILTVVALDAGAATAHPAPICLSELLHRAEVIIAPLAAEKQLPLIVEPPTTDVELMIDPDKALQLLLNLLSNAVKFTDSGAVRVRARQVSGRVEVDVLDTGMGLMAEHLERVFQPFWQVERPITRRAGGPGLGLAVSRRLADLLGGDIRIVSVPGGGSTFTAVLPIRPLDQGTGR